MAWGSNACTPFSGKLTVGHIFVSSRTEGPHVEVDPRSVYVLTRLDWGPRSNEQSSLALGIVNEFDEGWQEASIKPLLSHPLHLENSCISWK